MTARVLFSIILKVLGILFIKDILFSIPEFVFFISYYITAEYGGFGAIALFVLSIGSYILAAYGLIFKTYWLIDKLKLEDGLGADPVSLNMHRSTVLSISVIVIAL